MSGRPGTAARAAAQRIAERLAQDPRVRLVYLFGSAADPTRAVVRDLDLAVLTRPPLRFDERMALRADLESCDGLELDLVLLNDAPVVLAREIADAGQCLFARTPDDEVDFVTRARMRFWDFQPFRERAWALTGQRAADRLHGA